MRACPFFLVAIVAAGCGQDARSQRPIVAGNGSDPGTAPSSGPIALSATAGRGVLALTLTNASPASVTVATHVIGGKVPHYDWLSVELTAADGRKRALAFVDDRDESGPITVDLATGASHTEKIDLVRWAVSAGNGGPLLPGTYQLAATWHATNTTTGVAFEATASTTLVVEPPGAEACDGASYQTPAGAKLMLLGHQAKTGRATVDVGLYNHGDVPVCVFSHVKTDELHYDWFKILYADGHKYHHFSRSIALDDSRDKSVAISALLGPGQTIWHQIDVDAWARRDRNGSEPLPAGSLYTQITYDTKGETRVWSGSLTSDSFGLDVK